MARIAFMQNNFMEYLGVMYLSSLLKADGNEVEVFIGSNIKRQINELEEYRPDIVGFSCMTGMHNYAIEAARAIKSSLEALTILGGPHPTFFPEAIEEEGVDIICRGEGEFAMLELAKAISLKKGINNIANLWIKQGSCIIKNDIRPLIENLDSLSFPDRSIYYSKYPFMNNSRKVFVAGRGCPYRCTYCFNSSLQELYKGKGAYLRLRSVKNVIAEIDEVLKKYHSKTVYMMDDTFIINKSWLREFLELYRLQIKLPFICLIRADLMDGEIAKMLKSAGCYSVFMGVESGNDKLRNLILGKKITDQQIVDAAAFLKQYKINFRTYNMLGIPGENLEDAFKTVALNAVIKTDFPWCSLLQPYPKTEINEYARERGMLKNVDFPKYFFKHSILDLPHIKEISNLQKLFYWAVKFPSLNPLIKVVIKLPSNFIFDALFLIGYAYSYYKSERLRFREVLQIGWRNLASFKG